MSGYYYLDVSLETDQEPDQLLPVFFKSRIQQLLQTVFGEIGGHTTVDVLKFEAKSKRAILRCPGEHYVKVRAALTLVPTFQDVPCCIKTQAQTMSASNMINYGKDKVYFVTKEEHELPSKVELPPSEPAAGLILESGDINWNCPCLGGMATGPCGVEFRDAFSCFHYSEETPKGTECYEIFKTMQDCFSKYPAVYNKSGGDDDADLDAVMADSSSANPSNVESVDQDETGAATTAAPSTTSGETAPAKA